MFHSAKRLEQARFVAAGAIALAMVVVPGCASQKRSRPSQPQAEARPASSAAAGSHERIVDEELVGPPVPAAELEGPPEPIGPPAPLASEEQPQEAPAAPAPEPARKRARATSMPR
jgi:hypothetical protein